MNTPERKNEKRKLQTYSEPKILATYGKEELEAIGTPHGDGFESGGGGCGCGGGSIL